MKKFFKYFGIFLIIVFALAAAGLIYYNSKYPQVDKPKNIRFEYTQAMVERGKYLANHVTLCMDCHSTRDWTKFSGPIKAGTEGKGGERFGEEMDLPGTIYSRNITPAGLHNWTDGEIFRAITSGVSKDGTVLFPLMPYPYYNHLAEEDIKSLIAYLRSLKPIKNEVPASSVNFPVNLIIKSVPQNYVSKKMPDKNNPVEYGKYIVTVAVCNECHSPSKDGELIKGKEFSGGNVFDTPIGIIRTANITPDPETGIGSWTKEVFFARFRYFLTEDATKIRSDNSQTVMPWTMFAGMTDEDLGAIYEYLRTVKPVKNKVVHFSPPNQQFMNTRE